MKQFVIDGNKVVLSVTNPEVRVDDAEFEENEVYAVDIVASTGEGKVMAEICFRVLVCSEINIFRFMSQIVHVCGFSLECWMRSKRPFTKELWRGPIT